MEKEHMNQIKIQGRQNIELFIEFTLHPEMLNKPIDEYKRTWLHVYSAEGNLANVKILLEHGARDSITALDNNLQTPLHHACIAGHKDVVQLLIESGANKSAADINKETCLHFASFSGYSEIVQILLDKKANPNVVNKHELSPLHYATMGGHIEIANKLFLADAELKQANNNDYSALHISSAMGNLDISRALVEHRADVNLKEKTLGWMPIDFAKLTKHTEIVEYLVNNGASEYITVLDRGVLATLSKGINNMFCNNANTVELSSDIFGGIFSFGIALFVANRVAQHQGPNQWQLVAQDAIGGVVVGKIAEFGAKKMIPLISELYSTSSLCERSLIDISDVKKVTSLAHAEKYLTENEDSKYLALGVECKLNDKLLTSFQDFGTDWTVCEAGAIGDLHEDL